MIQPSDVPAPPEDLPQQVAATVAEWDTHDLRETIIYAQELLHARHEPTLRIEPRPGEEIVRTNERESYTVVVKKQPCGAGCSSCPHGPYVYHVTSETHPDGKTRLHWTLIGRDRTDTPSDPRNGNGR